ncbi:MAG: hypothetical protein GY811_20870 [Myxococcales bacterium]|nr:hypothetical protein [Myxococcales bacterium]
MNWRTVGEAHNALLECGTDTLNPDCDLICDEDVTVVERETFGVVGESGETFRLFLGAGIATNAIGCASWDFPWRMRTSTMRASPAPTSGAPLA